MRTALPAAALAAAALAFGAPAASADYPTADCDWQRLAPVEPSTGTSTYEIAVHGYAYLLGDVVTIRCYVEVDGVAVFSTPTLPGATAGHGSVTVGPGSWVNACREVTWSQGTSVGCAGVDPPLGSALVEDVVDFVEPVIVDADLITCPVLVAAAGTYGAVVVNAQGDVYVAGEPVWDCPPYDIWPPA